MRFLPPRLGLFALALSVSAAPLGAGVMEDRAMEDAIKNSYVLREVVVDPIMVQLYIRGGTVEVRGQAADEQERALIVDMITAVVAPLPVDNRLFVDSAHRRSSDRWLAARIRAGLQIVGALDSGSVQVEVLPEGVVLTGSVRTESQRQLAEVHARALSAPRALRNQLQVSPNLPEKRRPIDDPSVLAMLRQVISAVPTAKIAAHELTCREGEVMIDGTVATEADRELVTRLASSVRGVKAVSNRLRVNG